MRVQKWVLTWKCFLNQLIKKALIEKKHNRHTFIGVIISIQLLFKWYSNVFIESEEIMCTECSKKNQTENYNQKAHFKETIRK